MALLRKRKRNKLKIKMENIILKTGKIVIIDNDIDITDFSFSKCPCSKDSYLSALEWGLKRIKNTIEEVKLNNTLEDCNEDSKNKS